jgi:hypothetical protein
MEGLCFVCGVVLLFYWRIALWVPILGTGQRARGWIEGQELDLEIQQSRLIISIKSK